MYLLSNMAILGSYVRFLGCNRSQNVSILKFFFDNQCHSVPHEKCRQGLVVQKAEALTDDAEKAVRGSNLDHWIPPQKSVKTPMGTANRSLNLLPHFCGGGIHAKRWIHAKSMVQFLREFRFPGKELRMHCLSWFFYPTGKPPEKYHQNSKLGSFGSFRAG